MPIKNLTVRIPFNVASIYRFNYTPHAKGGVKGGEEPREVDVRTNPRYMPVQWTADKPDFTEFAGVYEATVALGFDPPSDVAISMMLDKDFACKEDCSPDCSQTRCEQSSLCEVYVNGARVDLKPAPEFAAEFFLTDFQDVNAFVGHLLKRGENTLKVVSPTKLSEPLRLVGEFGVRIDNGQLSIDNWKSPDPFALESDYPFFSGTVTYRAEFLIDDGQLTIDNRQSSIVLDLHDVRDTATVRVNGKLVGTRLWAPYVFEIAEFATAGVNTIEVEVHNNMANLILGQTRPFGLRSMPELIAR